MNLSDYVRRSAQDSERASVAEILTGGEVTPDRARRLRAAIEVAAESYDDATAAEYPELYPAWKDLIGQTVDSGFRFRHDGKLYKTIPNEHTFQADWIPGVGTESIYTRIDETHAGTLTDPIPYDGNMELFAGLYYVQNGVTYLCNRNTGQPVYNALADLVGLYVEVVDG